MNPQAVQRHAKDGCHFDVMGYLNIYQKEPGWTRSVPMQALILVFVVLLEIEIGLAVASHNIVNLINHSTGHQVSYALCARLDRFNNCFDFTVILCNGIKNTAGNIVIDTARKNLTAGHVAYELCIIHWNSIIIDTLDSKDFLNSVHCA